MPACKQAAKRIAESKLTTKHKNKKVLVAMSGGVDSAVCAYQLNKAGYECVGAMMLLTDSEKLMSEAKSAEKICEHLEIPFHLIDLRDKFQADVINYFTSTYMDGKTPNPCIMCNKTMKFGEMFKIADGLDCQFLATGHYAQVVKSVNGKSFELHKAVDAHKDQSYVLHFLEQERLSRVLLPLGILRKEEVRQIAKEASLPCANKPESQDICFVEDGDYAKFIEQTTNYKPVPGSISDSLGKVYGQHNGLLNYTIGQRKGLGVAFGQPMYVTKIDTTSNTVVVGTKQETMQKKVEIADMTWINGIPNATKISCSAKLRYRQTQIPVICKINDPDNVVLISKKPISAIAPGQFGVLYDGDKVLGGGTIQ